MGLVPRESQRWEHAGTKTDHGARILVHARTQIDNYLEADSGLDAEEI